MSARCWKSCAPSASALNWRFREPVDCLLAWPTGGRSDTDRRRTAGLCLRYGLSCGKLICKGSDIFKCGALLRAVERVKEAMFYSRVDLSNAVHSMALCLIDKCVGHVQRKHMLVFRLKKKHRRIARLEMVNWRSARIDFRMRGIRHSNRTLHVLPNCGKNVRPRFESHRGGLKSKTVDKSRRRVPFVAQKRGQKRKMSPGGFGDHHEPCGSISILQILGKHPDAFTDVFHLIEDIDSLKAITRTSTIITPVAIGECNTMKFRSCACGPAAAMNKEEGYLSTWQF